MSKAKELINLMEKLTIIRVGDFIVQRHKDLIIYGYVTKILKNGSPYGVQFEDSGSRHGGKAAFHSFGNAYPPFEPIADAEIPEKILKKMLAKAGEKPQGGSPWHNESNDKVYLSGHGLGIHQKIAQKEKEEWRSEGTEREKAFFKAKEDWKKNNPEKRFTEADAYEISDELGFDFRKLKAWKAGAYNDNNESLREDNQGIKNKWAEENYRILVKNDQGKFMPIEGVASGKPQFVTNVINGLVLWNLDPDAAKDKFDAIKSKYPDLEFKFVKA